MLKLHQNTSWFSGCATKRVHITVYCYQHTFLLHVINLGSIFPSQRRVVVLRLCLKFTHSYSHYFTCTKLRAAQDTCTQRTCLVVCWCYRLYIILLRISYYSLQCQQAFSHKAAYLLPFQHQWQPRATQSNTKSALSLNRLSVILESIFFFLVRIIICQSSVVQCRSLHSARELTCIACTFTRLSALQDACEKNVLITGPSRIVSLKILHSVSRVIKKQHPHAYCGPEDCSVETDQMFQTMYERPCAHNKSFLHHC